ncbi:MAG: S41 family peptidase [Lysobacteraceae bacterium]
MRRPTTAVLLLLAAVLLPALALAQPGYHRDPDLHGQTLVFAAEGDLWVAAAAGGSARRLTSIRGQAAQPAISPDGRRVAFVADYDGALEAYVMPLAGGPPRRLSFEGGRVVLAGWSPGGEVVYATDNRSGPSWQWVLRAVDPDSLARRELPLADAREAAFDERGRVVFTRFGLAVTADNVREYRGGAMAQLWRFDPSAPAEAERLGADHPGNLERPMWWQGRLYALSDASGSFNLWRFDGEGGNGEQLTFHEDFEVRGARLHDGRVVYQLGADIGLYDIRAGRDATVALSLSGDRARSRERWLREPLRFLDAIDFGPDGERVALTARGQVALAGVGALRRVELPLDSHRRARAATLSPDGDWVYAIVDEDATQSIWRFRADGSGSGEALTGDLESHRTRLVVSPDGRHIAHDDRRGRLWLLEVASRRNQVIDDAGGDGHGDIVFSPDGRHLAFVRAHTPRRRGQLTLYTLADGRSEVLTSDRYDSFSPAFTPDQQWLFFLSNRNFEATPGAPWGDRNMGPMFDRRARIYALALQPDNRFALQPRDEFAPTGGDNGGGNDTPTPRAIQREGLAGRLFEAPLDPGNYRRLSANQHRLYLVDQAATRGSRPVLRTVAFAPDVPKLETFAENVATYALSADGKKLFYRLGGDNGAMYVVPAAAKAPDDLSTHQVRVGDWRLAVQPAAEWRQMFDDAWRMQREFLFDPGMRGQDWDAVRERYRPLVERVGDRAELDDLLGQMVAELGVLHSQVRGGEYREDPERAQPAFLGGAFERVPAGARITRVYRSDPELPNERSPLARPGVDLREGDVITAVNGREVAAVDDIAVLLAHTAGQQVRLDVLRGSQGLAVVTVPVDANRDAALRYSDWVLSRRERVEAAGDGRIGYLHLRAMGPGDIADFAREFYANVDREGLVIDVRRNRGGNIDSWVIEKLLRRAWSFWQPPHQAPYWNMQQTFRGHLVVLADPLTYSDGETFSAGVKSLGLGPLVGLRTAGAGVWLSDTNRLVDQGLMRAAQTGQFGADGRWLIEGSGVAPDVEVDNLPHATWRGEDAQLARAIELLQQRLAEQPVVQPPAAPIRPRGQAADDAYRID